MKERPILFSAEMVKAILDGRKTKTRRVIKPIPASVDNVDGVPYVEDEFGDWHELIKFCPYVPGMTLWVRESYRLGQAPRDEEGQGVALYADNSHKYHPDLDPSRQNWCRSWKKRPSIFMPRWASRITLRVTGVRVERLQEITDTDAIAEGITLTGSIDRTGLTTGQPVDDFATLWDSINAKRGHGWDSNPYVWVIEFTKEPQDHGHPEQSLPT